MYRWESDRCSSAWKKSRNYQLRGAWRRTVAWSRSQLLDNNCRCCCFHHSTLSFDDVVFDTLLPLTRLKWLKLRSPQARAWIAFPCFPSSLLFSISAVFFRWGWSRKRFKGGWSRLRPGAAVKKTKLGSNRKGVHVSKETQRAPRTNFYATKLHWATRPPQQAQQQYVLRLNHIQSLLFFFFDQIKKKDGSGQVSS